MRRRPGNLLPIEVELLEAALELRSKGEPEFHGFGVAKRLRDREGARNLVAHGTLYKVLGRMTASGLLESRWEESSIAEDEGRPRRRLYRVSGAGEIAYHRARLPASGVLPTLRRDPI
jgi:PadR family transcriptional regulator, regulatory protein PadR